MSESGFWKDKKVLVTGGTGFIGSHLVELLLGLGARVRVPRRPESSLAFLAAVEHDAEFVEGDLLDPAFARSAAAGQEIVMHLAASVGGIEFNMKHPASIFRDNLRLFMNAIEAARLEGAERFLVTSSACVYPRFCTLPTPEGEGFAGVPEPTNQGYGWAKRMEEFLGKSYHDEFGMKVAIARPYNAYGPRDNFDPARSHVIPALVRRVVEGENPLRVWGDGSHSRSFLFVTDFARGLVETAEKYAEADPLNLGSDEEVRIAEVAEAVRAAAGTDIDIVFDPKGPTGQPRRRCDTRKAKEKLGFEALVPFREGIQKTVDWYREHASRGA